MKQQSHDVDVLISGGGLIGSAMALALAQQGFSVAVTDLLEMSAHAAPDFDGRAYAIAPGSQTLLCALGLWDAVAPQAEAIQRITVTDRCTAPVPPAALHFDPSELDQPSIGWVVEDRWLRTALMEAVVASDAITRFATRLSASSIERTATGVRASLPDGTPLHAHVLIACDGRNSSTAREAGIQYLSWGYDQMGLVCAIEHESPHDGTAHQGFFAGGPFAVLPLPGNRSSLVWSERRARAEALHAMAPDDYLNEIRLRIGGRLGNIQLAGRRWAYPLGLSLAMSYARPRLVVAGDAAHGVHPIAGQGMNMGLRDVAALTEVLVEAARRGEDIGQMPVLERYQQWRRFDATAMALGMDAMTRVFSTPAGPVQALRNLGLGAVARMAGARRFFMAEASGLSGSVPRLMAGEPL